MPGTQQLRQLMGHSQFGARIHYGDCIFFTISPNPQMSALVLRLSRYREGDPYVKHGSRATKDLAGQDYPRLEAKRRRLPGGRDTETSAPDDAIEIELPEYDIRRIATNRDPLAVMEGYRIEVFLRLAAILGVRMCPNCPRCNETPFGCQDLFGSNMRPGGGILGGMSAFGGSTEHQSQGAPHLHAEGHVVCVYQYGTLEDVADKIKEGFLDVKSCYAFNENLHRSDVLDGEVYEDFLPRVDGEFEQRYANQEHDAMCTTPEYIVDDSQHRNATHVSTAKADLTAVEAEGASYRRAYFRDAQYIFSRVQHHVHKKTKDGYVPLKYCAKKVHGKQARSAKPCATCKQDFPMSRLCIDAPVLVCRGIAKRLGLKITGRRNSLGKIIGRRTGEWQSGTTAAFAVLFRSNTHTAPNYRVPILPMTHNDDACPSRKCKESVAVANLIRILSKLAQRAQREATGYYCGYTFKAQPIGAKYLKAAGESLNYMDVGLKDKTPGQMWHAATHRILTEFQHRCMSRTAPEEFNLSSNSKDHDPTAAEFVRTYRSEDFPGGELVRRLETEEKRALDAEYRKTVPKNNNYGSGSEVALKHFTDIYGYRGNNAMVYYLNPWEFLTLWEVLQLPKPMKPSSDNPVPLTRWVRPPNSGENDPGEYEVNPDAENENRTDILFYKEIPGTVQLRDLWYMRRRLRPMIPSPANTPMPDKERCRDRKARLFSLYLRPWVLEHATASVHVPHITDLDLIQQSGNGVKRRLRLTGKQSRAGKRSYETAWSAYVRGGIVSHHAKRIIVQFLAACCGKSSRDHDMQQCDTDAQDKAKDLPDNAVSLTRVHSILDEVGKSEQQEVRNLPTPSPAGGNQDDEDQNAEEEMCKKALRRTPQMQSALKTTAHLWKRDSTPWSLASEPKVEVNWSAAEATCQKRTKRRAKLKEDERKKLAVTSQCRAYVQSGASSIEAWKAALKASDENPTEEQWKFLDSVIKRCAQEQAELGPLRAAPSKQALSLSETTRCCLFGIPGAGKSHCIKLVRKFFEECLKWEDGVQFQFLAQQNSMARLVRGKTINTWAIIPVNPEAAKNKILNKDGDIDELFMNCVSMRWLIIDECSVASPWLLGCVDAALRRACLRHPYARAGSRHRPFGGINIVFSGDLWQLAPVKATPIYANPFKKYTVEEQMIFKMFWRQPENEKDCIQETFALTESKRTTDAWLQQVLKYDREGRESWEMYCFTHGLPTRNPGCWVPGDNEADPGTVTCTEEMCKSLRTTWAKRFAEGFSWAARATMECDACKKERRRRCCIISLSDENKAAYHEEPFKHAPYVNPFRYPSTHAQHLRAINFARAHKRQLLWLPAHDAPMEKDGKKWVGERAERNKENYLQLPHQRCGGIPGLFPMVEGLPVRFTDTPDRKAREVDVFKNARGWLRGWALEDTEKERIGQLTDAEVVLQRRPSRLFIEMDEPHPKLPKIAGHYIFTLAMRPKEWSVDGHGNVKMQRYGFTIVPDFGGTAHAYCGFSLEACIGELLPWWRRPTRPDALTSYIIRSRVKDGSNLLLTQPYSPQLFRQGNQPGPHLLNEVLQRRMTTEDARLAWANAEKKSEADKESMQDTGGKQHYLASIQAPCRRCTDRLGEEVWKPLSAFYVFASNPSATDVWQTALAQGQDLCCLGKDCTKRGKRSDVLDKIMLCNECNLPRVCAAFDTDMQTRWLHGAVGEPIYCKGCLGKGRSISQADMYFCNGSCQEKRPSYQFFEEDITAAAAGEKDFITLYCARCWAIKRVADDPHCREQGVRFPCAKCHKETDLQNFSPVDIKEWVAGKRLQHRWSCIDCKYPLCDGCQASDDPQVRGRRPLHAPKPLAWIKCGPLHAPIYKYYCIEHRYPACSGKHCADLPYEKKAKRVNSTKNRFKAYVCDKCKGAVEVGEEVADEEAVRSQPEPEEEKEEGAAQAAIVAPANPVHTPVLTVPEDPAEGVGHISDTQTASLNSAQTTTHASQRRNKRNHVCDGCGMPKHANDLVPFSNGNIVDHDKVRCRTCAYQQCATCGSWNGKPLSFKDMDDIKTKQDGKRYRSS